VTVPPQQSVGVRDVSTQVLIRLRDAITSKHLKAPIGEATLVGFGIRHQLAALTQALGGHSSPACIAILDVAIHERASRKPSPELVWTGPEAPTAAARDTAVALRQLFDGARESVILAGYSFDHARDVLAPLHASMKAHGFAARFFVDVEQIERGIAPADHLRKQLGGFVAQSWPFGAPYPRIHFDKRSLIPGPPYCSLHAKCVVVDGHKAFISSANFTQRGQERNIEVGVLVEDPNFASFLAAQWLGLIDAGVVGEYTQPYAP